MHTYNKVLDITVDLYMCVIHVSILMYESLGVKLYIYIYIIYYVYI